MVRVSQERTPQRDTEQGPVWVADLLTQHPGDTGSALPSRPVTVYRTIAVLAGFVLLCAAATASTAALSGPRVDRAVPGSATDNPIASITGVDALHPDLINSSVGLPLPGATSPPAGNSDPDPARSGDVPDRSDQDSAPQPRPGHDAPPPDAGLATPDSSDPPPTGQAEPRRNLEEDPDSGGLNSALGPILGTVTTFYETAPGAPRQAFDLLDPQMRGTGYDEFRQAWAGVRRAIVEDIRLDGPNTALVIVRLERDDGTTLRTLQRVLVTPGAQPRIADAQLLSASRS